MGALFLDAGGVFFLPNQEVLLSRLAELDLEVAETALVRLHCAGMTWVDTQGSGEAYWEGCVRSLGLEGASALEAARSLRGIPWNRPIAESVEALREIAARQVPIAIVSNTEGGVESDLREHGVCQVGPGPGVQVSAVVMSSSVGVEKPDPAIFAPAFAATGSGPGSAMHVGDSVHYDVGGGRAAGIRAIHLDQCGSCRDQTHEHISTLGQLPALIAAAGWGGLRGVGGS